jgi:integrase/recombinase XerD
MRKYVRKGSSAGEYARPGNRRVDITLGRAYKVFISEKSSEGVADSTLTLYEEHFRYLSEYLEPEMPIVNLTPQLLRGYKSWMMDERKLAPTTVNIRLRTLRTFLKWLYAREYIQEPLHDNVKQIREPEPEIDVLTVREINQLLKVMDDTRYVGFRDRVMVCVLLDTMVRISELLRMRRSNVNLTSGTIKLEAHETKVKRGRTVPISSRTLDMLREYMAETADFNNERLFLNYDGTPVMANTWRRRLVDYAREAGLEHKRIRPHLFRHTGAVLYLLNGGDPFSLRLILGHSDMSMVKRYINMTAVDVKKQHNAYSPLRDLRV